MSTPRPSELVSGEGKLAIGWIRSASLGLGLLCALGASPLLAQEVANDPNPAWVTAVLGDEAAALGAFMCEVDVQMDRWSAVCFHPSLAEMRDVGRTLEPGPDFDVRLCRALDSLGSEVPTGSIEVYASGPLRDGQSLPDSVTIYRLLYTPHATEANLGVVDENPGDGSPWLHHAGECTAHVMWSERRALE